MRNLQFIPFYNLPMLSGSRLRIVEDIRLSLELEVHAGTCEVQKEVEKSLLDWCNSLGRGIIHSNIWLQFFPIFQIRYQTWTSTLMQTQGQQMCQIFSKRSVEFVCYGLFSIFCPNHFIWLVCLKQSLGRHPYNASVNVCSYFFFNILKELSLVQK